MSRSLPTRFALQLSALLLGLASLPALAGTYSVQDTREGPVRAESRNTGRGAELVLAERRISPRLPARLQKKLREQPAPAADVVVSLRRAEGVLFVENAFATPGVVSPDPMVRDAANRQWPDELTVLRDASPTARKRYTVHLEGEVGGTAFAASGSAEFTGNESRRHLERAVAAALEDAVRQITAGHGG